jgi:dynein heavy chain
MFIFIFKLSNEVIRRCTASINLDMVFDGFVVSSKKSLNESIDCCNSWKEIYSNVKF